MWNCSCSHSVKKKEPRSLAYWSRVLFYFIISGIIYFRREVCWTYEPLVVVHWLNERRLKHSVIINYPLCSYECVWLTFFSRSHTEMFEDVSGCSFSMQWMGTESLKQQTDAKSWKKSYKSTMISYCTSYWLVRACQDFSRTHHTLRPQRVTCFKFTSGNNMEKSGWCITQNMSLQKRVAECEWMTGIYYFLFQHIYMQMSHLFLCVEQSHNAMGQKLFNFINCKVINVTAALNTLAL